MKKFIFISIPFIVTFLIAEFTVRLLHIPALQNESYYFGFSGCPKYFQKARTKNNFLMYKTNPQKDIQQTTFPVTKSSNTFRIFVLGGSAAYGEPFGPNGAFSRWLGERLRAYCPDLNIEVINCAIKGFGSVRVRNIFDEISNYEPNLIILYFGNNEERDYRFHRIEINIEIRPFFKSLKHILDHSYIFRMVFN